jgi:hypothetical protein
MVKIPLELLNLHDDGFHLLVEVVVFGQTFTAVVDTGASRTVFDKSTVERYLSEPSLLEKSSMQSTGLGTNTMASYSVTLPEIQIGQGSAAWRKRNYEVAVLDLSTINYAYEQLNIPTVIGVIGGDILVSYAAIIDYKMPSLRLRERPIKKATQR